MSGTSLQCHGCGSGRVTAFPEFGAFHRVTSDCRPFRPGGRLLACGACGIVQKNVDAEWRAECLEIYASYSIYKQAGGSEQKVFDAAQGGGIQRSERLLARLLQQDEWPGRARMLDIGCGNGALLRVASRLRPDWRLCGTELNDRHRAAVESIPGVERFHVGDPAELPGPYDLISAVHVLEHIPDPGAFLGRIRSKLAEGGALFLQTPDLERNPMDLLVADHCSHFTRASLPALLRRGGCEPACVASDWVPKELSVLSSRRPGADPSVPGTAPPPERLVLQALDWLGKFRDLARAAAVARTLGIFGSSIAATWIFAELGERADFFIDEDPDRTGRTHLCRPILSPDAVPRDADVIVALAPEAAKQVRARLQPPGAGGRWFVPPPFQDAGGT